MAGMDILGGQAAAQEIKALLAQSSQARIAVAYWGDKATETLGLAAFADRNPNVQVACDLMSGASNPQEVKRLMDLFGERAVRAVPALHAKVWLTDAGAIIGSSNASANGLGHEGKEREVAGLIEANLRIAPLDDRLRARWEDWFKKEVWDRGSRITPAMLELAQKRWDWRRRNRPAIPGDDDRPGSLLEKLRTSPEFFRDKPLKVWIWKRVEASATAEKALKVEQAKRGSGKLSFYEKVKLKPGEYILDWDWDAGKRSVRLDGFWKVAGNEPVVHLRKTHISLVYPVPNFQGLTIKGEARAWKTAILTVVEKFPGKTEIEMTAEDFALALRKP